ncbi:MAG: thioredoxin family protein [Planctomycetaceae bacterium]
MIRTSRPLLLTVVLWATVVVPARGDAPTDGWLSDFDSAIALARDQNRPLLIHFYTDWCNPCKGMERNVLNRPEVLSEIRRTVVAVKLNAERAKDVAARYNVNQYPTDIFVEPNGRVMMEASGQRPLAEYRMMIARAGTRYSDLLAQRARPANPEPKPQQPTQQNPSQQPPTQTVIAGPKPMLDGYCPVTLWKNRRWEKGSPQFRVEHRGQVYLFASADAKKEFEENADRYAPRFLGCDPVVVFESDRAVLGSTKFAAFYDDELFLFVDDINRQAFKRNPDSFVRTRVVLNVDQIETVTR